MPERLAREAGFTLIELMVVICIIAVLAGAGAVSLRNVGESMKLTAFSTTLLAHLHHARGEAIKRNGRVVLCKSADGNACAAAGGWEQGWILFHDVNNNGVRDGGESLLRRGEALPEGYKVVGNQTVARYVSFSPFGGTRLTSGAFQAGTITVCRESLQKAEARQVVITAVGRPRIKRTTVDECS